ncbi:MAG: hypothetical protein CMB79_00080 [Filomicrobium sp.]|nr:hypothetical protein [Filomicrobium sp.]
MQTHSPFIDQRQFWWHMAGAVRAMSRWPHAKKQEALPKALPHHLAMIRGPIASVVKGESLRWNYRPHLPNVDR